MIPLFLRTCLTAGLVVSLFVETPAWAQPAADPCEALELPAPEFDRRSGRDLARYGRRLRDCATPGSARYMDAYRDEARGWFDAGAYQRVEEVAAAMMRDSLATDPAARSVVNELAGRANARQGRDIAALHRFDVAVRLADTRIQPAQVDLLAAFARAALATGAFDVAESALTQALDRARGASIRPAQRADIHLLAADAALTDAFDRASPVRILPLNEPFPTNSDSLRTTAHRHLQAAQSALQMARDVPDRERLLLPIFRAGTLILADSLPAAADTLARVDRGLNPRLHVPAQVRLHEFAAHLALRRGDRARAMAMLEEAERAARHTPSRAHLARIVRFRVEASLAAADPTGAQTHLDRLRSLAAPGASYHLRQAALAWVDRPPAPAPGPWAWALATLGIVAIVGAGVWLVCQQRMASDASPLSSLSSLSNGADGDDALKAGGEPSAQQAPVTPEADPQTDPPPWHTEDEEPPKADLPEEGSRKTSPGYAPLPLAGETNASAVVGVEAMPRERVRLTVYDPDGNDLGTIPLPRILRRHDPDRYLGLEMGSRVLIIEQMTAASSQAIHRTDGGGFEQHELPVRISGVVVASIERSG